jgi:hypothetical protein
MLGTCHETKIQMELRRQNMLVSVMCLVFALEDLSENPACNYRKSIQSKSAFNLDVFPNRAMIFCVTATNKLWLSVNEFAV